MAKKAKTAPSKRYSFEVTEGVEASFRYTGKGRPSKKFLMAMKALGEAALRYVQSDANKG